MSNTLSAIDKPNMINHTNGSTPPKLLLLVLVAIDCSLNDLNGGAFAGVCK
jgi:hypothetical protein